MTVKRSGLKSTDKPRGTVRRALKRADQSKFEKLLLEALNAEDRELKVPISLRLDLDIYRELKRRAEAGEMGGKYQKILIQILRHHLFGELPASAPKKKKRA